MAVESTMLPLGTPAPSFELPAVQGGTVSIDSFAGAPALLVMFICNHCPYVKHVEKELGALVSEFQVRELAAVGICSNDVAQEPEDTPEGLLEQIERTGFSFPYLIDETQEIAHAYGAVCTPDFFLFDSGLELVYRGQMDSSRPRSGDAATGADLRAAIEAVLSGEAPSSDQRPSMGCGISWKPGNEPQ